MDSSCQIDGSFGWWRWNYGVGNVFLEYIWSFAICGHNSEEHSLLQHRFRSHVLTDRQLQSYNVLLCRQPFSRTMHHITVFNRPQFSLRNMNQSLICFHGQFSPQILNLLSICGTISGDHLEAQKRHHSVRPNLELKLYKAWVNNLQQQYQQFVESTSSKILVVIRSKGGPTCYQIMSLIFWPLSVYM